MTDRFALGYDLPAGWSVGIDAPNARQLVGPNVYVNIAVLDAPIDPDDPAGRAPVAIEGCAAAFIDWLDSHPYLEGSEPAPASVAGLTGAQVDVVLAPPEGYESDCGPGCMNLLRFVAQPAQFDRLAMDNTEKDRWIALDANGSVLILNIWTPAANPSTGGTEAVFVAGLESAQSVLDSMTFEPVGS